MIQPCACSYPMPDGNGDYCSQASGPAACPCVHYTPRPAPRSYLQRDRRPHQRGVEVW